MTRLAVARRSGTAVSRRAYASAQTFTDLDESEGASYLDIVQAIVQAIENHGFLRGSDGWRLSPAFDINPNPEKDAHIPAFEDMDPTPDSALWRHTMDFYRLPKKRFNTIEQELCDAVAPRRDVAAQPVPLAVRSRECPR